MSATTGTDHVYKRELTEDERTLFTYVGPEGANVCDTCRIVEAGTYRFLLLGKFRNTSMDAGVWTDQNGNVKNWDYVHETVVASGQTMPELVDATRRYVRLVDLSRTGPLDAKLEALLELAGHKPKTA